MDDAKLVYFRITDERFGQHRNVDIVFKWLTFVIFCVVRDFFSSMRLSMIHPNLLFSLLSAQHFFFSPAHTQHNSNLPSDDASISMSHVIESRSLWSLIWFTWNVMSSYECNTSNNNTEHRLETVRLRWLCKKAFTRKAWKNVFFLSLRRVSIFQLALINLLSAINRWLLHAEITKKNISRVS